MKIRFKNLPLLLRDMEAKRWMIDVFDFPYKKKNYIVVLTLYRENEKRPSAYAKVKLQFIRAENISASISAYADFYEVHFGSVKEFSAFFGVRPGHANRDLFLDFSEHFAPYIPVEKIVTKINRGHRLIQARCCDANDPNALYLYDIRRNGIKKDGTPCQRSIENNNKAQTLRPRLFEIFKEDMNISFFFSSNPEDDLSDEEIMKRVNHRV